MSGGEFGLISRIRRSTKNGPSVLVGIGDDTAVLRVPKNKELLFTTDMLVEGRHFRLKDASPYQIGRKALAVNISDIAAMGGMPTQAVIAVGLPKKSTGAFTQALYRGFRDLARLFHVELVGGDTNRSDRLVLSVALLGEVEKRRALKRSGAKVGDELFVSGPLGGSYASKKHLNFIPRVKEARWLAKHVPVHAMMDISDGLASDVYRMAEESRVGILLEEKKIPVSRHAKNVRQALGEGEDFELLFAVPRASARKLPKKFIHVGRVVSKAHGVKLLTAGGKVVPLRGGYDHFR